MKIGFIKWVVKSCLLMFWDFLYCIVYLWMLCLDFKGIIIFKLEEIIVFYSGCIIRCWIYFIYIIVIIVKLFDVDKIYFCLWCYF